MVTWRPDPSFYPSPKMAMQAPPEKLAYVALLNPNAALNGNGDGRPDALAVSHLPLVGHPKQLLGVFPHAFVLHPVLPPNVPVARPSSSAEHPTPPKPGTI